MCLVPELVLMVATWDYPSTTTLIGPNQDNVSSGALNLPFTFNYLGQTYTQYSVTDNGLLLLMNPGDTPLNGSETTNSMAAVSPGIKIAPYWDDLSTGTDGYVKSRYILTIRHTCISIGG